MKPIFSRRDAEWFTPSGQQSRHYFVAPLTFRERQAFRADLAREGGIYPAHAQMLDAIRAALRELAPANLAELLNDIEAAEMSPDDANVQAKMASIEAAVALDPGYANLLAARQHYMGMLPYVAARHALRDWKGEGLPPFARVRGLVPDDLLETLPQAELEAIGWQASILMQPAKDSLGNSEAPSPSPASLAPLTGD